ncbi:hypothetical protein KIPB_011852, partial [Kipferlia bialata]|eukprot:g11852.t1
MEEQLIDFTAKATSRSKKYFRMGRQVVMQKLGKAQKLEEDPQFRTHVSEFRSMNTVMQTLAKNVSSVSSTNVAVGCAEANCIEQMRAIGRKHPNTHLASTLETVCEALTEIQEYREEYTSHVRDNPAK